MKEPKRRQSLSGAVLIMILTVMFVLIILLTATLTTVTTANQRIYTKYEENQAYYTARSALDVFTQNMLADKSYYAYSDSGATRKYIYGDGQNADMKQGLGLQLDLYSITSQGGMNITQADLYSYANGISVSTDKKDEYKNYFGIKPTAGAPSTLGTDINEIWYEIELPKTGDGSNKYGKLSDYKSSSTTSVAKVKVEVLDRRYDMGNVPITIGGANTTVKDYVDSLDPNSTTYQADLDAFMNNAAYKNDIAKAIVTGNRKKDTMRVKITATTTFDGVEGTAVLIYDSNEPPVNNSSRAITAFGSAKMTNHTYIVGGLSMIGDPTDADYPNIQWRNGGGVYGTVYNEVGANFTTTTPIYLTESEYLFIGQNMTASNDIMVTGSVTDTSKDKRPYIYIGGTFTPSNQFSKVGGGTNTEKVDMIVHGISWIGGNSFTYNGDIYSDGNCTFDSTAAQPNISGNLYVKGDLTVGGNAASDDGSGNLTLKFGPCNIYVSGNVIYNGATYPLSMIISDNISGSINSFSSSDMVIPTPSDITSASAGGDLTKEIMLPGGVKKKIETHKTNYDDYYAMDSSGNYIDTNSDGNVPDRKTAEDFAGNSSTGPVNFTDSSFFPADELNKTKVTNPADLNYHIDTAGGVKRFYIHGSNHTGANIGTSGSPGNYSHPLEITGGGTVELVLKNYWGMNMYSGNIVVDDDTTLKIYGGDASATYKFDCFTVWTKTVYDSYVNGTTLNTGSLAGNNIKVPKIYYYFSDGSEIELSNGKNFFTGYFFGPNTYFHPTAGSNITFSDLKYNGASVVSGWKYTVLGSVLCNNFDLQNDHGIIYINPALEDDTAGEPIHQWNSYQYVRN